MERTWEMAFLQRLMLSKTLLLLKVFSYIRKVL